MRPTDETFSENETAKRREAALSKMLATPPAPRTAKKKPSPKNAKAKKTPG
jgi:hypothetical protein